MPFTSVEVQVQRFDDLGLAHRFVRYPTEDHLLFATQDRFKTVLTGLGTPKAVRNPRDIDYTWHPALSIRGLGIGTTTAYWLSDLVARDSAPGSVASLRATSLARPGTKSTIVRTGPTLVTSPLPAVQQDLVIKRGTALPRRKRLVLDLTNVKALAVDLARAGLPCGKVVITTDGRTRVRFVGSRSGAVVLQASKGRTAKRVC